MDTFEDNAQKFARTAAELSRLQGAEFEATLLAQSKATLLATGTSDDGWSPNVRYFALMLELPVELFAQVEVQRNQVEISMLNRIQAVSGRHVGNRITEVILSPVLVDTIDGEASVTPPHSNSTIVEEPVAPSFWAPSHFRLFISHANETKVKANKFKQDLAKYQIAAFVAHDDVEATREWQAEIESALRTMDGLLALVSPAFVNSRWCDQEVGFALGRRCLVVPVRLGADPHGFIGKYQGINYGDHTPSLEIFEVLIQHPETSHRLTEGLIDRLTASESWSESMAVMALLAKTRGVNTLQSARLLEAADTNAQIYRAYGVLDAINTLLARSAAMQEQSGHVA